MKLRREDIPEVVIMRLPLYLRMLRLLEKENLQVINSEELGRRLQLTSAQIRKDLSYFGRFGKQGKGYNVSSLKEELSRILGVDREWRMALVGIGKLGRAILSYGGFAPAGFRIVAAFDRDPELVGRRVSGLIIQPMNEFEKTVVEKKIQIGIIAVPPTEAQGVVDQMVKSNIRAVLNYAPVMLRVPPNIKVRNIDPVLALESMTYYLVED